MNDDAVGMGDQQPAADLAGERYLGSRHHAPEAMAQCDELAAQRTEKAAARPPELVAPNRQQQLAAGIPELLGTFPGPVGNIGADLFGSLIHLCAPALELNPIADGPAHGKRQVLNARNHLHWRLIHQRPAISGSAPELSLWNWHFIQRRAINHVY
ncbi:hypothetical protein [Bradyrhizobium sp. AZCC 1693]|uniref:hypothetical protein n=1 Tax=Bradyrhizobium sp. AZCC 1693 TaxID=3117029 RepID=UPI002FEF3370